jgi:hypothetical protein
MRECRQQQQPGGGKGPTHVGRVASQAAMEWTRSESTLSRVCVAMTEGQVRGLRGHADNTLAAVVHFQVVPRARSNRTSLGIGVSRTR